MSLLFKLFWNLLAFIGLITVICLLLLVYFLWKNDLFPVINVLYQNWKNPEKVEVTGNHPLLSSEQEKAIIDLGINPNAVPSEITPDMESCFVEKLGQSRVDEIKAGAEPTPSDVIKSSPCLTQ